MAGKWLDAAKPVSAPPAWMAAARPVQDHSDAQAETEPSTGAPMQADYTPSPDDSAAEAALRGAGQGATLGFGDELAAGVGALLPDQAGSKGYFQRYRDMRDGLRRDNKASAAEHPLAYGISEGIASLPISIAAGGAPVAGASRAAALIKGAGTAAALGGAAGLGASNRDDAIGEIQDAGKGAALGGALSIGGAMLQGSLLPLSSKARETFLKQGRRVLQGGASPMNALQREVSKEAVEEVGSAFRPLGTTVGTDARVEAMREEVGNQYGSIITSLKANGFTGPDAEALAKKMAVEGRSIASGNTNPAVRSVYDSEAGALRAQEPASPGASPDFTVKRDSNGALALDQAEDLKRSLQARAKYNRVNVAETPQNDARKEVASMYREANEDAIDRQAAASNDSRTQAIAAQFIPVKQQLGRLIEAGDALDKGVAQAARRSGSLHSSIAAAPALASGNYLGAAKSMFADALWRERGPSTVAWGARGARDILQDPRTMGMIDFLRRRGAPLAAEEIGLHEPADK